MHGGATLPNHRRPGQPAKPASNSSCPVRAPQAIDRHHTIGTTQAASPFKGQRWWWPPPRFWWWWWPDGFEQLWCGRVGCSDATTRRVPRRVHQARRPPARGLDGGGPSSGDSDETPAQSPQSAQKCRAVGIQVVVLPLYNGGRRGPSSPFPLPSWHAQTGWESHLSSSGPPAGNAACHRQLGEMHSPQGSPPTAENIVAVSTPDRNCFLLVFSRALSVASGQQ